MRARCAVVILGLAGGLVLVGCGATGTDAKSAEESIPSECAEAPMRMQVELHGEADNAGGPDARITDVLALGTPILRGTAALEPRLSDITVDTSRSFHLYLADFDLSHEVATSRSGNVITAENLLGIVTLEPAADQAIAGGDVLPMGDLEGRNDPEKAFARFTVEYRDGDPTALWPDSAHGAVEILYLDDQTLCARIDMQAFKDGKLETAIRGTVSFPLVEAGRIFTCERLEDNCEMQPRPTS